MDSQQAVHGVRILLCFVGTTAVTAFLTMLLPVDWMASTHERLGLGEFPRAPIVDYLARSVSAFYGFHGVLLFIVASDPVRFKPIVTFVAIFNIIFGLMLIAIDFHAGMPAWWTMFEGPFIIVAGLVLAMLCRRL